MTLLYSFETTFAPVQTARLKIEINTREHFCVLPLVSKSFAAENSWFTGTASLQTYAIEELLGTKLRALYQRKKGRDLYDLWRGVHTCSADPTVIVACFQRYMEHNDLSVSRAMFEENLAHKRRDPAFLKDMPPLLPAGVQYDAAHALPVIVERILSVLPGDPWQGNVRNEA